MSTDVYSQVLYNDGEGVVHTDYNNNQRFLQAYLHDGLMQYLVGPTSAGTINASTGLYDAEFPGQSGANTDTRWAYCPSPGAAFLKQGSSNGKIAISNGLLLQKIASSLGSDATLIPYMFTGAEEFTLTNGDVTNHRVDLLQMKLEYVETGSEARDFEDAVTRQVTSQSMNKRRRVQCTLSVKAGTAVSTTVVTYPAPDAGFVPVGAVVVGNGWTTAGTAPIFGEDSVAASNLVVHDLRMPLRVRGYRVDPTQFKLVTAWALSNSNSTVSSSNATNLLYVPCPAGLGRFMGFSFHLSSAVGTLTPAATAWDAGRSSGILTATYSPRQVCAAVGFKDDVLVPHFVTERQHIQVFGGGVGPEIQPVGNNTTNTTFTYGPPLWTSGRRVAHERQRLASVSTAPDTLVLRLQSGSATTVIGAVMIFIAEGI